MQIEIVIADIATVRSEVVAAAANNALAGGSGVDARVDRATGIGRNVGLGDRVAPDQAELGAQRPRTCVRTRL
jgi:O-acetyl-ADP-ribose deacetylase (regulator of RNase III)